MPPCLEYFHFKNMRAFLVAKLLIFLMLKKFPQRRYLLANVLAVRVLSIKKIVNCLFQRPCQFSKQKILPSLEKTGDLI